MHEQNFDSPGVERIPIWELVKRFHGHLGPWIALGYKIGIDALHALDASPHFEIDVEVGCPLQPPVSCLIDGLQLSTGATYGKRNIRAKESSNIFIRIRNVKTGTESCYSIPWRTRELISNLVATKGIEQATFAVWDMDSNDIFENKIT